MLDDGVAERDLAVAGMTRLVAVPTARIVVACRGVGHYVS